jgi:hypothetical protein
MAVKIKIIVFWFLVPCSMVVGNQHLRGHALSQKTTIPIFITVKTSNYTSRTSIGRQSGYMSLTMHFNHYATWHNKPENVDLIRFVCCNVL